MTKRPNSRVNLDKAIERLFGNYEKSLETRSIMANAIIGQIGVCGGSKPPPYDQRCRFCKSHVEKGTCETEFSQVPVGYKAEGDLPHRRWYCVSK